MRHVYALPICTGIWVAIGSAPGSVECIYKITFHIIRTVLVELMFLKISVELGRVMC